MRTISRVVWTATALALLCGTMLHKTRADQPNAPLSAEELVKALAAAGQPGAEHKKLEPLVGHWAFTMKLWADPNQPPVELKGTNERKWIMDGRYVEETTRGEYGGKTVEAMSLIGFDAGKKKFTCVRACGVTGQISTGTATSDSTGTRFECVKEDCCPITGQMTKGRDEIVIESRDRIVVNMYKTINDREVKVGEMVSIRQK